MPNPATCHCCGAAADAACVECDLHTCDEHAYPVTIPYPQHDSRIDTGEVICTWCAEQA